VKRLEMFKRLKAVFKELKTGRMGLKRAVWTWSLGASLGITVEKQLLQVDCDRINRGKKKKAEKDALAMVSAMVNFRAAMWYWLGVKPALSTWVANRRTASST